MDIMRRLGKKVLVSYLGDGLYAVFDGFGIWLLVNSYEDPTDKVYLEPDVFQALVNFEKESKKPAVIEACKGD